jgi:hypothetical protein
MSTKRKAPIGEQKSAPRARPTILAPELDRICSNCGRAYGPADGIRYFQYSGTSLLGLRSLFADRLTKTECPACKSLIDFEPAIFFLGIDPPVAYFCGGDALGDEQIASIASSFQAQAAADGRAAVISQFKNQDRLKGALVDRLRSVAGAMTPLNEANKKGDLSTFLLTNWRSITPEVLVASDVLTLVQHVLSASSDETHKKGIAYFSAHGDGLGRIQAHTWLGLCIARGAESPPDQHSLEHDLAAFIVSDVIFNSAVAEFEDVLKKTARNQEPLVLYCMLSVLAQVRKLRRESNPFDEDWSRAWIDFELSLRSTDQELVARLTPMALSKEAVAGTIRRRTLFDVAGQMVVPFLRGDDREGGQRVARALDEIFVKAGYPDLGIDLIRHGIVITLPEVTTAADAIAHIDAAVAHVAGNDTAATGFSLEYTVNLASGTLIAANDVQAVKTVFEHTLPLARDLETRADLEAWYGATLLRLHHEQFFLEHVGADERPWEAEVSECARARLWTERANALRACGRLNETLAWRKRVVPLYATDPGSGNHRAALRGLATAERETGAPDRALDVILPLLEDKEALDRINVLDTAAAIWGALGDIAKTREALAEALDLAVGPDAHLRQHFETRLVSLTTGTSDRELENTLLRSSRDGWKNPLTLLQECVAWLNMQAREHELSDDGVARYAEATAALGGMLKSGGMPPQAREDGYIVLATIAEQSGFDRQEDAWGAAADAADALGLIPQPVVVLALARALYRAENSRGARMVLRALPSSLARKVERVTRLDVALDALTNLGNRMDTLTGDLLSRGLLHDARVVTEFQRDPLRRAVSGRNLDHDAQEFLTGRLFAPVVRGTGAIVLEFIKIDDGLAPVLTWQEPDEARARTQQIDAPDLDLFDLRDRIFNKLQGWVRGRPGDPFNVKDWPAFRTWVRQAIGDATANAGHLVVIESEGLEGLPFHVAVAPEWTCSYASSWMSLAGAIASSAGATEKMTFAMVPAFADHPNVEQAMRHAGESLRALATRRGLLYDEAIGAACDEKALTVLLTSSNISFIACHGFVYDQQKEVAWVLAHNGGLPGTSGVLVNSGDQHANHVSWREIERLERTPRLVVSAACSSGRALVTGSGDRVGLYQSLARRGTRTLIAPAWDIEADLVLPIAARALQLHVDEHMTLAEAIRAACQEASHDLPDWCAWALTMEGAWQ